ncbi:NAD(P)/FAD-dependent oxidoreductase [Luteolibacter algae]|uniref:NAD(P)/FAD-dependent oxidoreductase n=1 Tax=Luteolibacter algae TaxID=454151 RepID=A0ABW5D6Q2_9BACT
MPDKPTIAIIGTGISGLACAYFLKDDFVLSIFEKEPRTGGHSNTVEVEENGERLPLDTGFMVYNEVTYPHLTRLFKSLDVATKPTDMSFSVQHMPAALEFNGGSVNLLFSQRKNLFRPRFWKMLLQINRFNKETIAELANPQYADMTLSEYVDARGYGRDFLKWYLSPMAAAVWSSPPERIDSFPARTLMRFWHNHGFLGLDTQHPWRTVCGGSREYVKKITKDLSQHITKAKEVSAVYGTTLEFSDGSSQTFDHVIFASHGDQSYKLLKDPSALEAGVLSRFQYQSNQAIVHTDASFMPRTRRAWAAWNYRVESSSRGGEMHSTHYWMNKLQGVSKNQNYFVSINPPDNIAPEKIHHRIQYEHPLFTSSAISAQSRIPELHIAAGSTRRYYCGAWQRYGFHEDGIWSAHRLCATLLDRDPWEKSGSDTRSAPAPTTRKRAGE